jgi:hypothetical protein
MIVINVTRLSFDIITTAEVAEGAGKLFSLARRELMKD